MYISLCRHLMKYSLPDIETLVIDLADKIGAPKLFLPSFGSSDGTGRPHIESASNGQLYFVIAERGEEYDGQFATNIKDLLYRVFSQVTFRMANDHEIKHRIPTQDVRRLVFEKQESLLGQLDPAWEIRAKKEHEYILRYHPFRDNIDK
jgi:hypothetical protein